MGFAMALEFLRASASKMSFEQAIATKMSALTREYFLEAAMSGAAEGLSNRV